MPSSKAEEKKRTARILALLSRAYPEARVHLKFRNAFELLAATILAAQCTDERVNRVTPALFKKFPNAARLAQARQEELEEMIRSTGFFRNKAKSLLGMSRALVERFGAQVPRTIEELVSIPGVGRKTANVLLGACFDKPAIVVDTHLKRVTSRLGLAFDEDPDKIEAELQELVPERERTRFSWVIGEHGRQVCLARRPRCPACVVRELCPYPNKTVE
jgi:endonuclease-3